MISEFISKHFPGSTHRHTIAESQSPHLANWLWHSCVTDKPTRWAESRIADSPRRFPYTQAEMSPARCLSMVFLHIPSQPSTFLQQRQEGQRLKRKSNHLQR